MCMSSPARPMLCLVPSVTKMHPPGQIFDRGVVVYVCVGPDKNWQKIMLNTMKRGDGRDANKWKIK